MATDKNRVFAIGLYETARGGGWRVACSACSWSAQGTQQDVTNAMSLHRHDYHAVGCKCVFRQWERTSYKDCPVHPHVTIGCPYCPWTYEHPNKSSDSYEIAVRIRDKHLDMAHPVYADSTRCLLAADGLHRCTLGGPHGANDCQCHCGKRYIMACGGWVTVATTGVPYGLLFKKEEDYSTAPRPNCVDSVVIADGMRTIEEMRLLLDYHREVYSVRIPFKRVGAPPFVHWLKPPLGKWTAEEVYVGTLNSLYSGTLAKRYVVQGVYNSREEAERAAADLNTLGSVPVKEQA